MNKLVIKKWAKSIESCRGCSDQDLHSLAKALQYALKLREHYLELSIRHHSDRHRRRLKKDLNERDFDDIEKISGIDLR